MGLAAAKNKRRLGIDPNNTRWSRDTDTFGQKILRAQGWQPGQFLGSKDAAHAHLHTDASASHIRVVLKEDNLGLGAKKNTVDECVGLDAFQHLLGRLNGKSEEVLESERTARESVKLTLYADRKWGPMRFVSGGLLVGDEIKEVLEVKTVAPRKESAGAKAAKSEDVEIEVTKVGDRQKSAMAGPADCPQEVKKSKKRKVHEDSEAKESKKERKSKRSKTVEGTSNSADDMASTERKKEKSRKSKRREPEVPNGASDSKARKKRRTDKEAVVDEDASAPNGSSDGVDSSTGSRSKKTEKKSKKDKKMNKAKKASDGELGDCSEKSSKRKRKTKDEDGDEVSTEDCATTNLTPSNSGLSTPLLSGYSTPELGSSARHLARKRFIAQKRMAFSDPKALSQIFMIKS